MKAPTWSACLVLLLAGYARANGLSSAPADILPGTAAAPFLIPAVIFVLISVPLVLGIVPRNRFYGIRTKKTLLKDRSWYAVNKFGGALIIFSSLIYIVAASLLPYAKSSPDWPTVFSLHLLFFVVPLLGSLCLIGFYSRKF